MRDRPAKAVRVPIVALFLGAGLFLVLREPAADPSRAATFEAVDAGHDVHQVELSTDEDPRRPVTDSPTPDQGEGDSSPRSWEWLPPRLPADTDLGGILGHDLLSRYWGAEWTGFRQRIPEGGALERMLDDWVGIEGMELGDRDAVLSDLERILVREFHGDTRYGVHRIFHQQVGLGWRTEELARPAVTNAFSDYAASLGRLVHPKEIRAAVDEALEREAAQIESWTDEIVELGRLASAELLSVLRADAKLVESGNEPAIGRIVIGPIAAIPHGDHWGAPPGQLLSASSTSGSVEAHGFWNLMYTLLLDDVPSARSFLESAQFSESRFQAWLDSVAPLYFFE